ncbi:hsp70 nucleotide exchange factor fes1 [Lobosporangium transversale]|uniref:Armadillo-type protein n=1 Tax=Lobosporangium transversale TaxID=64571 RepID=A0A1Y2GQ94_9FUNG|nr:armadillo-type protein [Lobosporangium transversale]KAF9914444.1 hsp70 nucleotide exchange factor fes1 [Lobosporangium transversale]ORZ16754.1 armadillo-type protein [Lobosporangium transversale]|eukprot:XP_021881689.1 armadillo-type protein [Lobosporangium transversale]
MSQQQKSLNELLKWSIINQATEKEDASAEGAPKKPAEKIDPGIIDAILGRSDSQMMLEALQVIKNPQATNDEKELAWEDFEMLIQQIDNASNIENMKMWPPILEELKNSNPKFREQAAWVCGTATQNNPKAQAAFLKENGLAAVIGLLSDPEIYIRAKAIYALSGAIKHFEPALEEFKNQDGFKTLVTLLNTESDLSLLRKTVFLINTLLIQDPTCSKQLAQLQLIHALDTILKQHMEDEDMVEKTLVTLRTFFNVSSSPIHPATLALIRPKVLEAKEKYGSLILDSEAWADLEKRTA